MSGMVAVRTKIRTLEMFLLKPVKHQPALEHGWKTGPARCEGTKCYDDLVVIVGRSVEMML